MSNMPHRNARRTRAWFMHGNPEVASLEYLEESMRDVCTAVALAGYDIEYIQMGDKIYIEAEDMSLYSALRHRETYH